MLFAMSVASSSDRTLREELWAVMRADLVAVGVPVEAWPRRLPRIYHAYRVRSAEGSSIEVLLAVRTFAVIRPVPPWDNGHSVVVRWGHCPDVTSAWAFAKQVAGWM